MTANYEWERRTGGTRPRYHLRRYTARDHSDDAWYTSLVAELYLSSPKRKRWTLSILVHYHERHVMYLDRMTEQEALSAAKVVVVGYFS